MLLQLAYLLSKLMNILMPSNFPGPPTEAPSWGNTEYRINNKMYWGISSFDPPEINTDMTNVFGQGTSPITWGRGNEEIPEATMELSENAYNQLYKDLLASDATITSTDVRDYPFELVETVNPKQGSVNSRTVTTYSNVRIKKVKRATRSQGTVGYSTTITLQISQPPAVLIENPNPADDIPAN